VARRRMVHLHAFRGREAQGHAAVIAASPDLRARLLVAHRGHAGHHFAHHGPLPAHAVDLPQHDRRGHPREGRGQADLAGGRAADDPRVDWAGQRLSAPPERHRGRGCDL